MTFYTPTVLEEASDGREDVSMASAERVIGGYRLNEAGCAIISGTPDR